MGSILQTFSKSFDFTGRATRKEFWLFALFLCVALGLAAGLDIYLNDKPFIKFTWPFVVFGLTYPTTLAVSVRRLHDGGRSGWWLLLGLVPVVGLALIVFYLAPSRPSSRGAFAWHWAHSVAIGFALLIGLLGIMRAFWVPYWIPSESAKPTLLVGDYIIARKISAADVERGDVLVFRHPVSGVDHIHRVIGLPGDTVQLKAGVVYLNGIGAPQAADGAFEEVNLPQGPMGNRPRCGNDPVGEGAICRKARLIETLPGGRSFRILNIAEGASADDTPVFSVPQGQYFFLGDNRDNAMDSRFGQAVGGVGFVPANHIIGRADRVIFSAAGRALWYIWTWRSDRFFRAIE